MPEVVELSVAEFAASQRKVGTLNARALRRGWTGRLTLSGERVTVRNEGRPLRFPSYPAGAEVVRVQARIDGAPACYAGWEFVAALDGLPAADGQTAWVVRGAPGADTSVIDRRLLRPGWCDHCRTTRAARRHLYAVRNRDSGELKQVGSTCVKDFTGWNRQPVFLSEHEVLEGLEGETGGEDAFTPGYVVTVAIAAVEAAGWVSRSLAADLARRSTADLVADFLVGRGEPGEAARQLLDPHLPAALAQAPTVVKTVTADLAGEADGYAANLTAALRPTARQACAPAAPRPRPGDDRPPGFGRGGSSSDSRRPVGRPGGQCRCAGLAWGLLGGGGRRGGGCGRAGRPDLGLPSSRSAVHPGSRGTALRGLVVGVRPRLCLGLVTVAQGPAATSDGATGFLGLSAWGAGWWWGWLFLWVVLVRLGVV